MKHTYKTELIYGAAIGVVTIGWILVEYVIGVTLNRPDLGQYTGFAAILIPIIGLSLGIRAKKRAKDGSLKFFEGVLSGVIMSVIAGLIMAVFIFVYLSAFPSVGDTYFEYVREELAQNGESQEMIDMMIESLKNQFSPISQAINSLIGTVVVGLIISLIVSMFVRTKPVEKSSEQVESEVTKENR